MSARDSESGSSTYKGGSGRAGGLGNGGIGGGMGGGGNYGGGMGGGAGRMGGIGARTGLTTGTTTYGNTAFGRPGGNAVAYGMRDAASLNRAGMGPTVGSYGNFRTPSGAAMFGNSPVQGQSFYGQNMGQALSQANRAQARQPQQQVGGLLGGAPLADGAPAYPALEQEMALPTYQDPMAMYTTLTPPPAAPYNPLGSIQPPAAPVGAAWTPASTTNPAIQSVPGYANQTRGGAGWRSWANDSNNWPKQGVPGTRSSGSTDGGYPSVNPRGAYPAGLR